MCSSPSYTFFVFSGFLFSFEDTGLFPVHLFHVFSTWFCSPESLDCMPLHLLSHSCTSRFFIAACQSPEILHRRIQQPRKTCFAGGLLDHRKLQILGSGSGICHWVVNQMLQPHLNIRAVTSLIRHVAFLSLMSTEPYGSRLESAKEPSQLYTRLLRRRSAVGVSHSGCVASLLPAAVAGWCLRCLLGGLCPRYSSTWLWVSQSEPFVYADRMRWLLTWKKWPRRVVL